MNTNYQMWITGNAEQEKLQIPVLPEKFTVSVGSKNTSVDVTGLGEITIKQARPAYQFSFGSFFPAANFPGIDNVVLTEPLKCVERINGWIESKKLIHVIITGAGIDEYCTIEKFKYYEQDRDVGTIYYDLTLKEYREVTVRQVTVEGTTATVEKTETRVDNTVPPETYTVKYRDCLWNIAKTYYGDPYQFGKIYEANKAVIDAHYGGPNMIWPGDVLTIP